MAGGSVAGGGQGHGLDATRVGHGDGGVRGRARAAVRVGNVEGLRVGLGLGLGLEADADAVELLAGAGLLDLPGDGLDGVVDALGDVLDELEGGGGLATEEVDADGAVLLGAEEPVDVEGLADGDVLVHLRGLDVVKVDVLLLGKDAGGEGHDCGKREAHFVVCVWSGY